MTRFFAGIAAVILTVTALTLAAPSIADAAIKPTGTRAVGNTYTIFWIKASPGIVWVQIGDHFATQNSEYWEFVDTKRTRDNKYRHVTIRTANGLWKGFVKFNEVDW